MVIIHLTLTFIIILIGTHGGIASNEPGFDSIVPGNLSFHLESTHAHRMLVLALTSNVNIAFLFFQRNLLPMNSYGLLEITSLLLPTELISSCAHHPNSSLRTTSTTSLSVAADSPVQTRICLQGYRDPL